MVLNKRWTLPPVNQHIHYTQSTLLLCGHSTSYTVYLNERQTAAACKWVHLTQNPVNPPTVWRFIMDQPVWCYEENTSTYYKQFIIDVFFMSSTVQTKPLWSTTTRLFITLTGMPVMPHRPSGMGCVTGTWRCSGGWKATYLFGVLWEHGGKSD